MTDRTLTVAGAGLAGLVWMVWIGVLTALPWWTPPRPHERGAAARAALGVPALFVHHPERDANGLLPRFRGAGGAAPGGQRGRCVRAARVVTLRAHRAAAAPRSPWYREANVSETATIVVSVIGAAAGIVAVLGCRDRDAA